MICHICKMICHVCKISTECKIPGSMGWCKRFSSNSSYFRKCCIFKTIKMIQENEIRKLICFTRAIFSFCTFTNHLDRLHAPWFIHCIKLKLVVTHREWWNEERRRKKIGERRKLKNEEQEMMIEERIMKSADKLWIKFSRKFTPISTKLKHGGEPIKSILSEW